MYVTVIIVQIIIQTTFFPRIFPRGISISEQEASARGFGGGPCPMDHEAAKRETWREFNVHGSGDDVDQPVDLFALYADDDEDRYETIQYDVDDMGGTGGSVDDFVGVNADESNNDHCSDAANNLLLKQQSITIRSEREYDKSTGMSIWKGSEIMYTYLRQHSDIIKDKTVLELGAGCGLCGLVCALALQAKSVLISDGDCQVLTNLRHNVYVNGLQLLDGDNATGTTLSAASPKAMLSCPQLIWGKNHAIEFQEKYEMQDIIIATDCVYITQSVYPLFETVNELLCKSGLFLFVNTCASTCPMEDVIKIAAEFCIVPLEDEIWYHDDDKEQKNPVYVFRRHGEEVYS